MLVTELTKFYLPQLIRKLSQSSKRDLKRQSFCSQQDVFNQDGSNKIENFKDPTTELLQLFIQLSLMNFFCQELSLDTESELDLTDPAFLKSL